MLMNNKCNVVYQWVCSYHRQNESTAVSDLGRKIQLSIQNKIGKDSEDTGYCSYICLQVKNDIRQWVIIIVIDCNEYPFSSDRQYS